jgi:hypothetical protein
VGDPLAGGPLAGGVLAGGVLAGGVVAGAAVMLLVTEDEHVTVAPPPLPEPLHWSIVTGSAALVVDGDTVHLTRIVPPPPFPELVHWVTAALLVLPSGLQDTVGCVPPPVPDWLHWLMVAGLVVVAPVMLLTTLTLHLTSPPPPLPEPSHWVTEVTSWFDGVVVVVHVSGAFAAPWHSFNVTVELVAPVARSRLLVTVTSQATASPPTLSVPLHWFSAGAAAMRRGTAAKAPEAPQAESSSRARPSAVSMDARRRVAGPDTVSPP